MNYGFAVVTSLTNAQAYKQFDSYNDGNVASSQGGDCAGDAAVPGADLRRPDIPPQIDSQYPPDNTNFPDADPGAARDRGRPGQLAGPVPGVRLHGLQLRRQPRSPPRASIASDDWTVPRPRDLSWGQTYYWTVQAYDGEEYSATPPVGLLHHAGAAAAGHLAAVAEPGRARLQPADRELDHVGDRRAGGHRRPGAGDHPRLQQRGSAAVSGAFGAGWSSVLDMKVSAGEYSSAGGRRRRW